MSALIVGALIAALALAFVLWPLLRSEQPRQRGALSRIVTAPDDSAVRALREIEFDRETGKLSDADYADLKSEYTARALAELRAVERAAALPAHGTDAVEALVRAARDATVTCPHCSALCAEPDAAYCSTCGGYVPGTCGKCGTTVNEKGARYCASCGWSLAA